MTTQNKQLLGWGLLGTPNGRQQTSDGIDKQIKFASSFDLEQQYGGCLPDPRQKDIEPLYCLKYRKGDNEILGLAEYRSIFEQGQTRAGTYFGAFVETINSSFGKNSIEKVLSALYELSFYQWENFIDKNACSYKESIAGKTFPAPEEQLNEIAENLQHLPPQYLTQTEQQGDLYIATTQDQIVETLRLLLNSGLFYRFKQIFFSASPSISQQMQAKKLVSISFAELKAGNFFTENWQDEVNYLHKYIAQIQTNEKVANEKYQQLERNFANEVNSKAASYIEQAQRAEAELVSLRNDSDVLKHLGKTVLETVANNAQTLHQENLAQFASLSSGQRDEITSQLADLKNQIAKLGMTASNQPAQEPQVRVETRVTPLTWVFAGLSLFLVLFLAVYVLFFSGVSEDDYNKSQGDLKAVKTELAQAKKELERANDQISQLNRKIENYSSNPAPANNSSNMTNEQPLNKNNKGKSK
ncbi:hypothetical protein B0187_02510 [Haemophilus paracuniculus]|uniref:Uncharacterized protein n=1 Tax=Haemophilus paracuniculus TaxID=734 RepID=A0A1T0AT19_9PAST|nr:hypothetical protein [Haemophilus paracuniculus]OOR99703.1 hypothetical protein B0187_02510 [Haemophilus paracuniculus]